MNASPARLPILYEAGMLVPSAQPLKQADQSINCRVSVWKGDITKLPVQCILNAAKPTLLGGGGIDGAIHRAAGPGLRQECYRIQGPDPGDPDLRCDPGDAKLTRGYNLKADYVIHTVGPIYKNPSVSEPVLRSCYQRTLKLAVDSGISKLALCGVSTGAYGYPNAAAAKVACQVVRDFMEGPDGSKITLLVFVTFVQSDVEAYDEMIPKYFPNV